MKALQVDAPGQTKIVEVAEPSAGDGSTLLQVRRVGLCGTDLNTFFGFSAMRWPPLCCRSTRTHQRASPWART